MSTARPAGMLASSSRGVVDWFTGTGFLALNALAFFVTLVVLVPWNIYTSPGDLWAADILVPWAFLLGFHALLVGVWALIRHVVLKDDNPLSEMTPSARRWQAAQAHNTSYPINFRSSSPANPAAATAASDLYAEEWNRQTFGVHSSTEHPATEPEAPTGQDLGDLLADWDTSWPDPADHAAVSNTPLAPEVPQADAASESTAIQMNESVRSPGPLSAAARAAQSGESTVDPELEWQWIEAAASAWLTRRESQTEPSHQ